MSLKSEYLGINPDEIKDSTTRIIVTRLLNVIETISKENQKLTAEVQQLKDENNRLKGEQGKPSILPKNRNTSSEKERRQYDNKKKKKQRKKKPKKNISKTIDCKVDGAILPKDAEFKGYETTVIPELIMKVEYIEYRREKFYSPSRNKTYLASLPKGYTGQFSPSVRTAVIDLKYGLKSTESNIQRFLNNLGCEISNATISRILTKNVNIFNKEKNDITQAGIQTSTYVQTDDTMARVKGENYHSHILCSPYFTSFWTEKRKDRLTVLDVLRLKRPRMYCINKETLWILSQMKLPLKREQALQIYYQEETYSEAEFEKILNQLFPDKDRYKQYRQRVQEAAYISGYHQEPGCIHTLICDDAPQFKLLTYFLALCWVHEGRHYKKLQPVIPYHRKQVDVFLKAFWEFYGKLLDFKEHPSGALAKKLEVCFDALCAQHVTYGELKERIAKTKANKQSLLTVLSHPEIPLHNNSSELGARVRVRDRDIRLHSMSEEGIAANDSFLTLLETAKKLGVNFRDYIHDRLSCDFSMPALADLIRLQATLPHHT